MRLSLGEAETLCADAAMAAGALPQTAEALARSVVEAEARGNRAVGLAHMVDYLEALRAGRLDGQAVPALTRPAPVFTVSDAGGGAAHTGFHQALPHLMGTARALGCAVFAGRNAFTCGALGHFVQPFAEAGLVALAATNGPALMAVEGGSKPVFCTNPLAFAAPRGSAPPILFDQASSATAFVSLRERAARGESLPPGWAIDAEGRPTTDPAAALRGALVAFGGSRGANIALMVEVLSAGLTGARWSLDAPSFSQGGDCPATGLFVLALDPACVDPGFAERMEEHAVRLAKGGVHLPGEAGAKAQAQAAREGLDVDPALVERIRAFG